MHDLDRQQLEYEDESAYESGHGELGAELSEAQELELASEVLELNSEDELEQFLGDLWNRARSAVSTAYNSPAVQAALPTIKAVGAKVLPIVAGKAGDWVRPGWGDAAKAATEGLVDQWLKEELEGMSAEDRELALARRYIRFAHDALLRAARTPERVPSRVAGQVAVGDSARTNMPGLVPFVAQIAAGGQTPPQRSDSEPTAGRWIRRGSTIEIEFA